MIGVAGLLSRVMVFVFACGRTVYINVATVVDGFSWRSYSSKYLSEPGAAKLKSKSSRVCGTGSLFRIAVAVVDNFSL